MMSTYTKYNVFTKENLSRIRNPGNASDGICEQRVIFSNNDNVYYGTFKGNISPSSANFINVDISGGTIDNVELRDVTIKAGAQTISIVDLTYDVSDLSTNFDLFTNEIFPNEVSALEDKIEKAATSDALSSISSAIIASVDTTFSALVGLSNEVSCLSDSIYKTIGEISDVISSQVFNDISALNDKTNSISTNLSNTCISIMASVDNAFDAINAMSSDVKDLSNWSNDISSYADNISSYSHEISSKVSELSNDIQEIQKNIRGGLNFMGVLSATENVSDLSTFLIANFAILYPDIPAATIKVRQGFFYPIHGENTLSHYNIGGFEIEHGDWLIAKDNFIVSAATSNDMTVFDAQDADAVRLGSDNTFTGINTFENKAIFNNISANAISVDSSTFVIDKANTLKDLSDDLYGKTSKNANGIESISNIIDAKTYLGSVTSEATELPTLPSWFESLASVNPDTMLYKGAFARSNVKVESISSSTSSDVGFIGINDYLIINKDIVASSINWSDVDVIRDPKNEAIDISTDLSTLRQRVDNAELSIDGLSNVVSVLSYQCMHYRGDLSGNDGTLSGWLQHTYGQLPGLKITAGSMHRVNDLSVSVSDALGNIIDLFKNDYIIFKHEVEISDATSNDFDIIHDALAEGLGLSAQMVSNDMYLSNAIDSKIYIDSLSVGSLCAIHISQDDFYQKVKDGSLLSNELYVVSSDYINAYGQQIKNLSAPSDLSDATTKQYVDASDLFISNWISSNFENTGISNAISNTIFNYDVLAKNDVYIINNLSVGGQLSVNGVQFGITTKISDNISTTIAETIADEINLSTVSGDTSLCITNNYITFTAQTTNIDTSSFNISHNENNIINTTSSSVQILSVINVESDTATITTLSSGQLSAYSSYINELSTNTLSSNRIIVPFDNIKDATTLCSIANLSNTLSSQISIEISGLNQKIYDALKPIDEKLNGITINSNTQTMFSALVDVISILSNLKEAVGPRS